MESNKSRVIAARKSVLLHSWEFIEKTRRVARILSLPAMFPWELSKGLRKPMINPVGAGANGGFLRGGLRFLVFGMTRMISGYVTCFTMLSFSLSPWTIASPLAAVVKIALDIIYDSQDADGSNFNDMVLYRYADSAWKKESFFHYNVPMLNVLAHQLQDAVSKQSSGVAGVYGYSARKLSQIVEELENRTKFCETKQTITNSSLDLIRLEEHGRVWVDEFVKECTKPIPLTASDAAKQLQQVILQPFGEAAKYENDTCYLAVSYNKFNCGSKTMLM